MPLWVTSAPGVNSSSLGSWLEAAARSISCSGMTVTAEGASVMRSAWREAE